MSSPTSRRLARARIYLLAAGGLLLLGLGLLLRGALDAARREQLLRREALAARVFDELEASLAAFAAAEEARPFVQWRREWVPPAPMSPKQKFAGSKAGSAAAPTRSPLAEVPAREFVRGYFQIEPEGSFASPMLPGPGEDATKEEQVIARVEELRDLNRDLVGAPNLALAEPEPSQVKQQKKAPVPQQAVPEDVQIQRALDQQAVNRQRQNAIANQPVFDPDLDQLSNFLGVDNRNAGAEVGLADDALDLRVTRFIAEPIEGSLRLIRSVEIDGRRWIQGLVVDPEALARWLEGEVLGPELAELVELNWDTRGDALPPDDPDAGRWTHRFAPPFSTLQVSAELGPVEPLASTSARLILGLGLGLSLALILVLVAVERALTGLVERAEERERFVAAVTHELRTPLTSIRMYSEMLEQGMVADPERQRSYHGTIRGEAERLSRLVEQVLSLARLEEGGRSLVGESERAPLGDIVAGVVELLEAQAAARGLSIAVELEAEAGGCELPRDPVAQILTNLVDNALKFTPAQAKEGVEIHAARREAGVVLTIRDRGPGVEAEVLPRMFEPFVRGRREHEQATPGTGIGLAVVRALVDELGGRIRGRNREGGGFEIELELVEQSGAR
jgi:signal transduction histidine kinase